MLLEWKPTGEQGPPEPPADERFTLMTARKAWGIKSEREWNGLTVEDRAEILAHEMIEGKRAAYRMRDMGKGEKKENGYTKMKRKMGIGKKI